jgi:hypothetical protein
MLGTCSNCSKEFRYNPANKTGKYCSNICQQEFQKKQRIDEWLIGGKLPGKTALKKYLIEIHGYKCSCCEISEWNNNPITLEIDHIDGDPYNNCSENLRFICPNCHSQTPTYRNKNKGNGRIQRRERAKNDYHRQKIIRP